MVIVLEGHAPEETNSDICIALGKTLATASGDAKLAIEEILPGTMVIKFSCSIRAAECLQELHTRGELECRLERRVLALANYPANPGAPAFRPPRVLLFSNEKIFHDTIEAYLPGHRILTAYDERQLSEALDTHHIDVILLDFHLPGATAMQVLDALQRDRGHIEIIVITAHSGIERAVQAMKRGAFDFLAKTQENYKRLAEHIERALIHRRRRRGQSEATTRPKWLHDAFLNLEESKSPTMKRIVQLARQVADIPLTVLVTGESGVGKEVIARYIHAFSARASGPFVAVNLATAPATLVEATLFGHVKGAFASADKDQVGKFEMADGGTIFLDGIDKLDQNAQTKLLRVLQEREVERVGAREPSPIDARIVVATDRDLEREVSEGRFRAELFFRLNVIRLPIPPLRQRSEDLPELVELLCAKHMAVIGRKVPQFTRDALIVLANYDWPDNIRELDNLVMRLVSSVPRPTITPDDIPPEYCLPTLYQMAERSARHGTRDDDEDRFYLLARAQFERYLVRLMINRCNGDREAAARALGISNSNMTSKVDDEEQWWAAAIQGGDAHLTRELLCSSRDAENDHQS